MALMQMMTKFAAESQKKDLQSFWLEPIKKDRLRNTDFDDEESTGSNNMFSH